MSATRATIASLAGRARRSLEMPGAISDVRVTTGDARRDGSCNGCNRMNAHGRVPYDSVVVLSLRSSSVRLCYDCAAEMLRQLESLR